MRRRDLFGRLAVVAAAVAVAPAVQAEAANDTAIRDARAEGYERGRAVESARAESRAMDDPDRRAVPFLWHDGVPRFKIEPGSMQVVCGRLEPLTFEAMAADCAARGCVGIQDLGAQPRWRPEQAFTTVHEYIHVGADIDEFASYKTWDKSPDLAHIDTWRRSLHEGRG